MEKTALSQRTVPPDTPLTAPLRSHSVASRCSGPSMGRVHSRLPCRFRVFRAGGGGAARGRVCVVG